jgi:hypothetical protein
MDLPYFWPLVCIIEARNSPQSEVDSWQVQTQDAAIQLHRNVLLVYESWVYLTSSAPGAGAVRLA